MSILTKEELNTKGKFAISDLYGLGNCGTLIKVRCEAIESILDSHEELRAFSIFLLKRIEELERSLEENKKLKSEIAEIKAENSKYISSLLQELTDARNKTIDACIVIQRKNEKHEKD